MRSSVMPWSSSISLRSSGLRGLSGRFRRSSSNAFSSANTRALRSCSRRASLVEPTSPSSRSSLSVRLLFKVASLPPPTLSYALFDSGDLLLDSSGLRGSPPSSSQGSASKASMTASTRARLDSSLVALAAMQPSTCSSRRLRLLFTTPPPYVLSCSILRCSTSSRYSIARHALSASSPTIVRAQTSSPPR
jgi:hypothetical protein